MSLLIIICLPDFMKDIKGMEEFFLCLFFVGDELNIVDYQDVGVAVFGAESAGLLIPDRVREFLNELFNCYINNL